MKNKIIFRSFEAEKLSSFDYAQDKIRYGFVPEADKLFCNTEMAAKELVFV